MAVVLTKPIPASFTITDQYVWLPDLVGIPAVGDPATIEYDVVCGSQTDEFLPCFSFTKAEWDSPQCDALCWYLSPSSSDFTFRTKLFRDFPSVQRTGAPWTPTVGTKVHVKCNITDTTAEYSVNGASYAVATFEAGDIPGQGYFGFARYRPENITVSNVVSKGLPGFVPTWEGDPGSNNGIKNLFRSKDVTCMQGPNVESQIGRKIYLDQYDSTKQNANIIFGMTKSKRMPPDAPWSVQYLEVFQKWVDAGCPQA